MMKLEKFAEQTVLVVGDMMLDKYIVGTVGRISPEAPVPVLRQREVVRKLGGAGNVLVNLTSMSASVRAIGRVGDDSEGRFFRHLLKQAGVDDHYLFSDGATIVKTRVSADNQQFIRIDEEEIDPPSDEVIAQIEQNLDTIMEGITVVIISDYAKGFVSEKLCQIIIKAAKERQIPVLVDPKGTSAAKYRGATALTPNNKEFMDFLNLTAIPDERTIRECGLQMCEENDFEYLIYTRSEKGISTISRRGGEKRDFPAAVQEVVDVTGAGDTVVSTIALALGSGYPLDTCVEIANVAASIVISRFGAAQTTIEEIKKRIDPSVGEVMSADEALEKVFSYRKQGKRIVFTNGCFDLVHAGHISSFKQARSFGDILVVGVNSDDSIQRIKGETRPIVDLKNRVSLLAALSCVDIVVPFEEDTPQKLIEKIKPDVMVKGKDWEGKTVAGADFVKSYGGQVEFIELEQGLSTTNLIKKILSSVGRGG